MSFRKSSHFQDPMEATGSFTGTFDGDGSGLSGVPASGGTADTASHVAGADVFGAVGLADTASLVAGSGVQGAVALADTASLVAGSGVQGAVALADTASLVAGSGVQGAVSLADTASLVAGSGVQGAVSLADTASLVAGSDVQGAVDTASHVAGADVFGAVGLADTASLIAGSGVVGAVGDADTASFGTPALFNSPRPIKTIANTNPYVVLSTDHTVLIDAVSGAVSITVTLPDIADFVFGTAARVLSIIKSTGSNDVVLVASESQDIIGDLSATLIDDFQSLTLQPSGATWWVI